MKANSQSGNVLFYILIAVALLASLMFAVSQSGRGSAKALSEDRARLLASEIIEYSNVISAAVTQLSLRGVTAEQLCFNHANWGANDYDHAGCTDDFNQLYSLNGAGVTWSEAPEDAMDSTASPDNLWHFYGDNEIESIGTTNNDATSTDIMLITNELAESVCRQINKLLGINETSDPIPTDTEIGETRYIGAFTYSQTIGDEAGSALLSGKTSGCFENTTDSSYTFYKVLLAR